MLLVDTHSHLYDAAFDEDRSEAICRAIAAGVEKIFLPAIDSASHDSLFATAREHAENCFPMMGLHPTSVNDNPNYKEELEKVVKYLESPPSGIKFRAVGEVGLDLYWSKDWLDRQLEVFEAQIELALQKDLPLVIHTRSAWKEMRRTLGAYKGRGLRGVMHSFSGGPEDYRFIKTCGEFLFGIGGVVTYKNSTLPAALREMQMEDIILETDSPYLTPVPMRGKRNESAHLPIIAEKVAEIKSIPIEEVAIITARNSMKIFRC